jgi:nucleoside-diphosphate-sugar epimerase
MHLLQQRIPITGGSGFLGSHLCERLLTSGKNPSASTISAARARILSICSRNLPMATGEAVTGPMNLGNPAEFTILELATYIIEMTGSRSRIVRLPLPGDDPRQRRPDIPRASKFLGWKPRTPLKKGLDRTIGYFETLLERQLHPGGAR